MEEEQLYICLECNGQYKHCDKRQPTSSDICQVYKDIEQDVRDIENGNTINLHYPNLTELVRESI